MSPEQPSAPGLNIGDILFVLSKHKWKIILATVLSLAAAAVYFMRAPLLYESQAKLMIRYVLDRSAIDQVEDTSQGGVTRRGDPSVVTAQIEILTSWDLADKVAEKVGVQRLAPGVSEAVGKLSAAGVVKSGLQATAAKGSNVIQVSFRHQNPELAKAVLDGVLEQYFVRHLAIYRSANSIDFVKERVDKSRTELNAADDNLLKLKKEAGILSLPEDTANLNSSIEIARTNLNIAETDLVSQRARVIEIQKLLAGGGQLKPDQPVDLESSTLDPAPATAGPEVVAQYKATVTMLQQLRVNGAARLNQFTPGSPMMRANENEIKRLEREQRQMEKNHPDLLTTVRSGDSSSSAGVNLVEEMAKVESFKARVMALQEHLKNLEQRGSILRDLAPAIAQAERTRAVEEENYKYMGASLAKAQTDEALDPSRIPNISTVQTPAPPFKDVTMRNKIAAGIAAAGPALSLAGVLLFGLFLNRSVKRTTDLVNLLGMSPMLEIPWADGSRRLRIGKSQIEKTGGKDDIAAVSAPWDPRHFIRAYAAAISDRLAVAFRLGKVTHKPKLIGVTGFSNGAGVSTLAAGLAAVLSESDEGRVLLVDLASGHNGNHPFMNGRSPMSLATAIHSNGNDNDKSASEKLCLAKVEAGALGASSFGLNRIAGMLPDLKTSQFDYVIFDMPPLEQTRPTAAMSGMLDKVLVIVEAEKTLKDQVKDGYRELLDCGAEVVFIMNKVKSYGKGT